MLITRYFFGLFLLYSPFVHSDVQLEVGEGVSEKAVKAIVSNFEQGFPTYVEGMYSGRLKQQTVCKIKRDRDGVFIVSAGCHHNGYTSFKVRFRCPSIDAECFWEVDNIFKIVHTGYSHIKD
jgi:hypothetical protein